MRHIRCPVLLGLQHFACYSNHNTGTVGPWGTARPSKLKPLTMTYLGSLPQEQLHMLIKSKEESMVDLDINGRLYGHSVNQSSRALLVVNHERVHIKIFDSTLITLPAQSASSCHNTKSFRKCSCHIDSKHIQRCICNGISFSF